MHRVVSRRLIALVVSLFALSAPLFGATSTVDIKALVDVDQSQATGCTVVTSQGIFKGIDTIVTTHVSVNGTSGNVTSVTRQTCTDPVANLFSAETPIDASGWPIVITPGGTMQIETHAPSSVFGLINHMRLAFTVTSGTMTDSIVQERDGASIMWPPVLPPHGHAAGHASNTRIITLDGNLGDWNGVTPIATGIGPSSPSLRFLNVYSFQNETDLYFAFAVQSNANAPTANDDSYTVVSGGTLGIAVPGVLTNDTDPNNKPLTAALVAGPQHGTLTLNSDGSFSYTNDGSPSTNDNFEYKANNGTADSNTAQAAISITTSQPPPSDVAPQFTSPASATFRAGQLGSFLVTTTGHPTPSVTMTGTLPTGLAFFSAPGGGTILGTPAVGTGGVYHLTFHATNVHGTATQNFTLTVNEAPAILSANATTFTAGAVSTFTVTTRGYPYPAISESGTLPPGVTLTDNHNGTATLGGTPTAGGVYPIVINANNGVGSPASQNFTLTVNQAPSFTSANATNFTAGSAGSFSVTTVAYPTATVALTSGALPTGVTFTPNANGTGTLSGTPAVGTGGVYNLQFTASNGIGSNAVQSFTLTVLEAPSFTSAATTTFTTSTPGTFTVTVLGYPIPTITKSGALPSGVTFTDNGNRTATLAGTPAANAGGTYPLTLTATNTVTTATQNFSLIVNQPPVITSANALNVQAGTPVNFTVTTTGYPAPSIAESGALPNGLTYTDHGNGTGSITGTPAAGSGGVYPITFTATNVAGTNNQNFTITACNTIVVSNPATNTATANAAFSQTFNQTGAVGSATFTTTSTLPAGLALSTAGVLSGTPTVVGSFPIVVTVTDANGCSGSGPTYTLTVSCQTITVTNPVATTGTVNAAFSQTFTSSNTIGAVTYSTASTLPAGLVFNNNGTLSGIPTQTGTFPITVTATDANGCQGTGPTYNLTIVCQTIAVTNPSTSTGTAGTSFSQTFTASNTVGSVTFTTASTLPAGLALATNGTLSGTPTQTGTFPITVTATDANGCQGTGPTYNLVINCQTITVTNPANNTGTAGAAFSEQFTQSGAIGGATFTTASTLPNGVTLSSAGLLSGTPTQTGTFPIVVTVTDGNGCTGSGATYNLIINCPVITVTNPSSNSDAAGTALVAANFTFTQSGAVGGATFTTASTLPPGVSLSTAGVLTGTPTGGAQDYPITVTVTDGNGCTGTSSGYILHITCPVITVTNPVVNSGTAGVAFSQTFTQSGGQGTITWSESGALPTGITLNTTTGVLSGTTHQTGSFPITVTATDQYGCQGTGSTYTLTINCQTVTVTNPATNSGTVDAAFSQTFTATGILDTPTWSETGALPAGITLDPSTGILSGTPTVPGSFPITVKVTDSNGCFGTSNYTLTISCQTITVTNPATNTGTVDAAFSQQFTQSGAHGSATFSTASTLPPGVTLSAAGLLSGTPTAPGNFPIVVTVTDSNGCTGSGATYNLTINCQVITVTNPATNTGTVDAAFSQQFTQSGAHATATFSTASTLPAGITLNSSTGVLSGTPTVNGTFPIVVTVTDANGCTGSGPTYTLTINCQTITVTNPANNTGTVSAPFSEQFTQSGAHATATFTTASTLPTGLTLSSSGLLSGTPLQPGSFPIVVTVTDANGCTGSGATYNLTINCQVITVTNPSSNSDAAGTPLTAANFTFTQSGAVGGATFTTASTLPTGVSLTTGGVLTGTPTQGGSFPITVTVTDGNGCTGSSSGYTLTITCPVITVTNPATNSGTAGVGFSQTFTQSGGLGTITWSESGALPTGITLNSATGVLSGTTSQVGSFPIIVTATDQNGCQGSGSTYTLTINCQTITVTNPGVNTGTVDTAFSQTFTVSGILGTVTWSETGALPAGITLNSSTGVLSGTPTVNGTFPITVKATDTNGCFGTSNYTLTINCQTITVTNPATNSGTVDAAFSQTFTQSGGHGTTTFSTASALPSGLTLSSGGVLSGTPTVKGTFPIVVTATDSNGCTGSGATYNLTINCQTITVTNPATTTGTAGTAFSQTFTQSGAHATATFTTASTLPTGFSLSTAGVLSGTTTQHGSFPIVVTVTDANGCTGSGATYTLTINCNAISVTNPATNSGTVASPFSAQFTSSGTLISATYSTASTLPTGITLSSSGLLSGTPTQSGSFPIVVTVTDGNGCTGSGSTYTLTIACNVITVTDPATNSGTAGQPFSATFTQSGGNGTITWSTTSTLPTGITLNSSTGVLSGTPTQVGAYPLVIKATDGNGCSGDDTASNYTLTINCNTVTVTNATSNTVQASTTLSPASNWTFTATGNIGTLTWSETGALPSGITLNSSTGVLSGSTTQIGSYPITVKATDSDGCFGTSNYTLTVTCPTITPARNGGGSFPAGTIGTAYTGQSFVASGGSGTYTFAKTAGNLPTGLSLSSAGALSGTPTATGTFTFTVTATDSSTSCTGSASFSIAINPSAGTDSYSNLVNNTQAVVTGGSTSSPTTPFVGLTGTVLANDLPSGGVAVQAGTSSTAQGGSVTLAADGTFIYTPPVTATALTSDSFTYTIQSDTGATGTPTSATGTVNLTLSGRVWYVKNNVTNGNGQSQSPFNSTSNFSNGARTTPDKAGDIIFIYTGDGTTTNQTSGIALLANEQLIGNGVALVVNSNTLVAAGTKPLITNTAATSDAVTLNDGNTVKGLTITAATRDGIAGASHAGATLDTLTIQNNTASGLHLTSMTGTVNVTNAAIVNNATGLDINNGTAAVGLNNTNSITANAGQRSVSIQNRPASAGTITVGATINDSGTGILVNNNASGTINFNGTETLSTTTSTAFSMTTNTGTTVAFSGTLGITTTTGTGFNATGGGTLTVTGTANVSTGAAAAGVNINGVTVGALGVIFNSVNTTGATTGVSLTSLGNGNVTINGGTINATTTGLSLSTLGTSTTTLSGVTISGATTGISGSTFGTLSIGSTVSVSGVTALNLATGAVTGSFTSVSSTGGTNGVNLSAVTGSWGTTGGSLTGATGATFNVSGGSGGTISWAGTINQANGANAVTIAGSNSNTINFSGTITTSGTSTGINISASTGTYNFTGGASTIAGTGGGITIFNEASGTISFGAGYSINGPTTAFKIGGSATNVGASITYSGTITDNVNGGVLLDVNSASGTFNGSLTMNGTSLSGSVNGLNGVKSVINNMTGTLNVSNLSLTSSNNNFTGNLLTIGGTNTAGSFTFSNLTLSATGTGHTGLGLVMSGGGTLTISGTSSINTGSTALSLNGVALGTSTLGTLTSAGGTNGVVLTSVTGNTLTATSGSLSGSSSTEFLVNGGSPSFSYGGSITSGSQYLVDVGPTTGITGGSLTFSGTLGGASTSAGLGIRVQNSSNSPTFTFSGTQTLGTTASRMATGSNTGAVTLKNNGSATFTFSGTLGIATSGTMEGIIDTNSATGTTLNINGITGGVGNSTIDTADSATTCPANTNCSAALDISKAALTVTLGKVNVAGTNSHVPVGFMLNVTTGSFTITGDNTGKANGSGGTINVPTTGTMTISTGSNTVGCGTGYFQDVAGTVNLKGINFTNTNTTYGGVLFNNDNLAVTLTANVTGCVFTGVTASGAQGTANLYFTGGGSASPNVTANVQNCYFNGSRTYGFAAAANGGQYTVTVNQCGFGTDVNTTTTGTNNPGTTITNPPAISLAVVNANSGSLDYTLTNNTLWGNDGNNGAVYALTVSGGVTTSATHLSGTISGNKIGKTGVSASGCANNCAGIGILPGTQGTFSTTISNNVVQETNSIGINVVTTVSGSANSTIVHINNNTLGPPNITPVQQGAQQAIHIAAAQSTGSNNNYCVDITGNTLTPAFGTSPSWGSGTSFGIYLNNQNNSGYLKLMGYGGGSGGTDTTSAQNYVAGLNTMNSYTVLAKTTTGTGSGFIGGASCP